LRERPGGKALTGVVLTLAGSMLVFTADSGRISDGMSPLFGNTLALVGALAGAAWVFMLALALGPQLIGHTAFNWALRRLTATFVAIAILGEPVGSALLAYFFFGEQFGMLQFVGFVLLLLGIFVAA